MVIPVEDKVEGADVEVVDLDNSNEDGKSSKMERRPSGPDSDSDVLVIDIALARIGKKALDHCLNYSNLERSIKDCMSGSKEKGEILVTSYYLIIISHHY